MTNYIFDSIKKDFSNYLLSIGVSGTSLRNYMSDISHFVSWAKIKIKNYGSYVEESLTEIHPFVNSDLVKAYKEDLHISKVPGKTINRRLSTLRHLSRFFVTSQIISNDFMNDIDNIIEVREKVNLPHPLINEFRSYLIAEKVSKNTLKNYLSDVRQFLNWMEAR